MKKCAVVLGITLIVAVSIVALTGKGSALTERFLTATIEYFNVAPNKKIVDIENPDAGGNKRIPDSSLQDEDVQVNQQENKIASNRYSLENATYASSSGKRIIKAPDDLLVLVNKFRNLPPDWVPEDLVIPNVVFAFKEDSPRKYMRKEAALALEELFAQAKKDKINIAAISGYRSYETQKRIFESNAKIYGAEVANMTSALPGQSEHQTGLAMDITSASVKYQLEEEFANTREGKWLRDNASKFGFIIRYPKGKESITKYSYEPWHVRYVGKETAEIITTMAVTLEEYFDAID